MYRIGLLRKCAIFPRLHHMQQILKTQNQQRKQKCSENFRRAFFTSWRKSRFCNNASPFTPVFRIKMEQQHQYDQLATN